MFEFLKKSSKNLILILTWLQDQTTTKQPTLLLTTTSDVGTHTCNFHNRSTPNADPNHATVLECNSGNGEGEGRTQGKWTKTKHNTVIQELLKKKHPHERPTLL